MRKDDFKKTTWRHLESYREKELHVSEKGVYRGKQYGHILPTSQRRLNILPSIREDFWNWLPKHTRLHTLFHHLSSSQAVCFNLFFPFVADEALLPQLLSSLTLNGIARNAPEFEFIPDAVEGTNIDFMIPLVSGARILIELKYTEDGFTAKKTDQTHLDKFRDIYHSRSISKLNADFHEANAFLRHYQIARNILHLGDLQEDSVIFLVPRSNANFSGLSATLDKIALPRRRSQIRIVYMEDLVASLQKTVTAPKAALALKEFRQKYLNHCT